MTTTAQVDPELVRLIAELCELDFAELRPDARLAALGLDSVLMVELAVGIEDTLGVRLDQEDVAGVQTLAELDACVKRLRAAAGD